MDQEEIDAELLRYYGHLADLIEEIRRLHRRPRRQRSAEEEAQIAHLRMIQAHQFYGDETLPPEIRTFYAALGAEAIAQDARLVALDKGSVAQLTEQMKAIRLRAGFSDEETWTSAEEPDEYRHLTAQRAELLEKIDQTMISFLLRRYRLDAPADLYEHDRATFEVHREVGRILMTESGSPPTEQALVNGYLGTTYGKKAVERVLSRLREIRAGG